MPALSLGGLTFLEPLLATAQEAGAPRAGDGTPRSPPSQTEAKSLPKARLAVTEQVDSSETQRYPSPFCFPGPRGGRVWVGEERLNAEAAVAGREGPRGHTRWDTGHLPEKPPLLCHSSGGDHNDISTRVGLTIHRARFLTLPVN